VMEGDELRSLLAAAPAVESKESRAEG
jgi:hypothetical protein